MKLDRRHTTWMVVWSLISAMAACGGGGPPTIDPGIVADDGLSAELDTQAAEGLQDAWAEGIQREVVLPDLDAAQDTVPGDAVEAATDVFEPLSIQGVTPNQGFVTGGNLVAVTGNGFVEGMRVFFGDNEASQVTVGGPRLLTCIVPPGEAGAVDVRVRAPDGREAVLDSGYTYIPVESLSVTEVEPKAGPQDGGQVVLVSGTGFVDGATVKFGDAHAQVMSVPSPHLIVVSTPKSEPGIVDVSVTLPDGQSATLEQAYEFLPTGVEALALYSVFPSSGPVGGGTVVVVKGKGFQPGIKVFFGGKPAFQVELQSQELLTCVTPKAKTPGKVDVRVENPNGTTATLAGGFEYAATETLSVTSVSPVSGSEKGGYLAMVSGTGFETGVSVLFGENQATNVSVPSPHLIVCTVPEGSPGPVDITVKAPDGTSATLQKGFVYLAENPPQEGEAPVIHSVWPVKGPIDGGTLVAINGSAFQDGARVYFGAQEATTAHFKDYTLLLVATPPGEAPGPVEVRVVNPDGQQGVAKNAFRYEEPQSKAPSIEELWPATGPATGGTLVEVVGSGFQYGAVAYLGTWSAQTHVLDDKHLVLVTPALEPGTYDLTVVNPDGQQDTLEAAYSAYDPATVPTAQPTLANVTPKTGSVDGGEQVLLSGAGFQEGMRVYFGFQKAEVVEIKYGALAEVLSPPHSPGLVQVSVVNPDGGSATWDGEYLYFEAPPFVASVEPQTGPEAGGIQVAIHGANFKDGASVTFGQVKAASVVKSSELIEAVTPPSPAGKVDVTVTNPSGLSYTLKDGFEYYKPEAKEPPKVDSVTPDHGPASGGYTVVVTGTGFEEGDQVFFGDNGSPKVQVYSQEVLTALVPQGKPGEKVVVSVVAPDGRTGTLEAGFAYDSKAEEKVVINAVVPSSGPVQGGTFVTVTGAGFVPGTTVLFDKNEAETTFVTPNILTAITPPGKEGVVDVMVKRPDNKSVIAYGAFSYVEPSKPSPGVYSVEPAVGPTSGGTIVSIGGKYFQPGAKVFFGAVLAEKLTFISSKQLVAQSPPGESGPVSVSVVNPDGGSGTLAAGFTYYAPGDQAGPPLVYMVDPYQGTVLGGDEVTVFGNGFKEGLSIFICGHPAQVKEFQNEKKVEVVTPPGDVGVCDVAVTNPDGFTGVLEKGFKYVPATPSVTQVIPAVGPASGGTTVVVRGSGFMQGAQVFFGETESPQVEYLDQTSLQAVTPPGDVGKVDVTVKNPGGLTGTLPHGFEYVEGGGEAKAPTIDSVVPSKGPLVGGTPVEVHGANFMDGLLLLFGKKVADDVSVVSEDLVLAKTPAAEQPGQVDVTVLNPNGLGFTLEGAFTYQNPEAPAPELYSISPAQGPAAGGTQVTILGANLLSGAKLYLGGKAIQQIAYVNPSLVTGVTPPGEGTVDLKYVGPDGQVALLSPGFTYQPGPTVDQIDPNVGPVAGGIQVTIYGEHFATGVKVFFGDREAEILDKQGDLVLVVQLPGADAAGKVDVVVENPDGQKDVLEGGFEYVMPPEVSAIQPDSGPETGGTIVLVQGAWFHPLTKLWFGDVEASQVEFLDSDRLRVVTPQHAPGTFDVRVQNPDGSEAVLDKAFTFVASQNLGPAPKITQLAPTKGPVDGGTTVVIEGSDFQEGALVYFGTDEASQTSVLSDTKIIATTPPAQGPGPVDVTVMNPDGQIAKAPVQFEYIEPAAEPPVLTSISPSSGPTKGDTEVTITGSGFQTGAGVFFGGVPAKAVQFESENKLVATTPKHEKGPVDVLVVNPDGQEDTLQDAFQYLAPPSVKAVEPGAGPSSGGTKVVITGLDFVVPADGGLGSRVSFCDDFAAQEGCVQVSTDDTTVKDQGTIEVVTPAHSAGVTDVAVVNPDGQSGFLPKAFVFNPPPIVASVDPDSGTTLGGTLVDIVGTGFQEGASVAFGGAEATDVVVQGATKITCRTPASAPGTVDVTVTNPDGGTSTLKDAYTFIPPPTIAKVTPNTGPETGGIDVTIEGQDFSKNPASTVYFGATKVPEVDTNVISTNAIVVKAPPGKGVVSVKVVNPDGQSAELGSGFTYVPPVPPPVVSYLIPTKGSSLGGYNVQVVGNGFMDGARVFFGKTGSWVEGLSPVVKNAGTLILVKAPAHDAGKVDVRVLNTDGQEGVKENAFEFVAPQGEVPLKVLSIEPNRSVMAGGGMVTISGQGFEPGVLVFFGKEPDWVVSPSVQYVSQTLLVAEVPPAPTGQPGKVDVKVANPPTPAGQESVIVTDGFTYTYTAGAVFVPSPGSRLPPEPHDKSFSLVGDFNGDGLQDIVVGSGDKFYTLVNRETLDGRKGWFSLQWNFNIETSRWPSWIWMVSGDFDEDGDLDVVYGVRTPNVYWYIVYCQNDGAGEFQCHDLAQAPSCGEGKFRVADLNCDGHLDIFIPRASTSTSCPNYIMLGTGTGAFHFRSDVLPPQYENTRGVALADVDLDGDIDILLANDNAMQNRLYYNNCNNVQMPPQCASASLPDCTIKEYKGHVYAFCNPRWDWKSAEAFCSMYGYHLATVDDADENNFIGQNPSEDSWIGFNDIETEGQWGWVYGQSDYTAWCGGQPDNSGNEDCAEIRRCCGYCWYDLDCGQGRSFVCESELPKCPSPWKFTDAQYGEGKNFPISGGNTQDVALVDLDQNGYPDAICANWGQQTAVYMNYGGNFALDDGFHWPQNEDNPNVGRLIVADFDVDGDADIVAEVKDSVRIYGNDLSDGGVGALKDVTGAILPSLSSRGDLVNIAVGDLDQDALPDIFWVNAYHGNRLLMNNGYEEGKEWTQQNRVGIGKFQFNTYDDVPEVVLPVTASALGDIDGDGDLDLIEATWGQTLYAFVNEGGRFVDETEQRMPDKKFEVDNFGIVLSDLNGDGDLDLLVANRRDWNSHDGVDNGQLWQLVNDGTGRFTDVTSQNVPSTDGNWTSIVSVDLDRDSDMDVLMGRWDSGMAAFINGGDVFNNGGAYLLDGSSTYLKSGSPDRIRRIITGFFDKDVNQNDPYPDFYAGRDGQNTLYLLTSDGFKDMTTTYLPAINDDTRDALLADFDNDGDEDIFVINWGQDRFHARESAAQFADVTTSVLPTVGYQSISGAVGDLDQDGLLDVVEANWEQRNVQYGNVGSKFVLMTDNLPVDWDRTQRVWLYDLDGDGDLDMYVVNDGQDRIYVNTLK